jgi:hypothetical protein
MQQLMRGGVGTPLPVREFAERLKATLGAGTH